MTEEIFYLLGNAKETTNQLQTSETEKIINKFRKIWNIIKLICLGSAYLQT